MVYDHLQQKSNEQRCRVEKHIFTPWKINMEPKNGGLEDDVPFQLGDLWVPC